MEANLITADAVRHATAASAPAVFITVQRFCHDRSLPKSSFYKEVKAGHIKPTKRGRRTLIHQDEAKRYDSNLLDAA